MLHRGSRFSRQLLADLRLSSLPIGELPLAFTNSLAAFTYSDTDLLLVFRKSGFNDVLFNLGTISNYLGRANGSVLPITNFDFNLVQSNFATNLTNVEYVLMAVTTWLIADIIAGAR